MLNRREAITNSLSAAIGACGFSGIDVHSKDCGGRPLLVQVKTEDVLSFEQVLQIKASLSRVFIGTELDGVPVICTPAGVDVEIHGTVSDSQADMIADRVSEKINP